MGNKLFYVCSNTCIWCPKFSNIEKETEQKTIFFVIVVKCHILYFKKSCIQETLHILTCADRSNNTKKKPKKITRQNVNLSCITMYHQSPVTNI